ncbi:MAG: hypothetical protein NT027_08725 [Proteobacteria bacterium]|nr:hypothetical protein [Pseudomonadota bacterium]
MLQSQKIIARKIRRSRIKTRLKQFVKNSRNSINTAYEKALAGISTALDRSKELFITEFKKIRSRTSMLKTSQRPSRLDTGVALTHASQLPQPRAISTMG